VYDEELTPTDSILLAGEVSPRLREIEITHQITAAPGRAGLGSKSSVRVTSRSQPHAQPISAPVARRPG
jgi:hypothetical protein